MSYRFILHDAKYGRAHSSCQDKTTTQRLTSTLLEGVGAGAPVSEEQGETHGLEDAGNSADGDGVKRTLLGQDLGDNLNIVSKKR